MRIVLRFAERIDRLSEGIAHTVRWGLLANALVITGNAFSRKFFCRLGGTLHGCGLLRTRRNV